MSIPFNNLIIDLNEINANNIISSWEWLVINPKQIIIITALGDLFTVESDESIYLLQTDLGIYKKVADNLEEFYQKLDNDENIDNWFLPLLIQKLMDAKLILKANEVYSCKMPTVLGGTLSPENIHPVDLNVHFEIMGAIHKQIKDLPDGTKVNINFEK